MFGEVVKLPATLRALRHRNYTLFISGQVVSFVGGWIQSTAQGWLVYRLTSDAFLLGLVNFASQIPVLFLGIFAGIVADSFSRHRLILFTQLLFMLQAFAMAALTLVHTPQGQPMITIWYIVGFAAFAGVIQAFDLPARQAFLVEMVPPVDLGNAVALNSLSFNAARVVGPSVAGQLIAFIQHLRPSSVGFGEGMCFLINGCSFLAVIVQLLRMRIGGSVPRGSDNSSTGYLLEGVHYLRQHTHIRDLLCFVGMMAVFGLPYLVLMPIFAKDVLRGSSVTFGALMTSVGVGAIAGGIAMARRSHLHGIGKVIAATTAGFSLIVTWFSWTRNLGLSCVTVALAGWCMVSAMIGSQTLLQTLVAERFRGRVMSFYSMVAVGLSPFGALLSGALAKRWGAPWAMTINAAICLLTAAVFARRLPKLRLAARSTPEYQQTMLQG